MPSREAFCAMHRQTGYPYRFKCQTLVLPTDRETRSVIRM